MDNNQTQINEINELIETIKEAYNPGSVTNVMVAAVLQLLNKQQQNAGNSISAINTATAARRLIFGEPATLDVILKEYNHATSETIVLPVMSKKRPGKLAGIFLNFCTDADARHQMLIGCFDMPITHIPSVSYGEELRILFRTYPADNSKDNTDAIWNHFNPEDLIDVKPIYAGGDVDPTSDGELVLNDSVRYELFNTLWCNVVGGTVEASGRKYLYNGENYTYARASVKLCEVLKSPKISTNPV